MLVDGKVDAFATDDILLYGLIVAAQGARHGLKVVGDFLSYEPYGIMFRKDEPQLAAVVERSFRKLATNRDLVPLYQKWFVTRLPTGEKLDVSPSRRNSRRASRCSTTTAGGTNWREPLLGRCVASIPDIRTLPGARLTRRGLVLRTIPDMTKLRKTANPARSHRGRLWRIRSPGTVSPATYTLRFCDAANAPASRTASPIVAAT